MMTAYRYRLDGVVDCSLRELLEANEGLGPSEVRALVELSPGERLTLGGGGFAEFEVERLARGEG